MLLGVAQISSRAVLLLMVPLAAGSGCRRSRPVLSRGDASVVLLAPPVPLPPGLTPLTEREPTTPGEAPMLLPLAGSPGVAVVGTLAPASGQPADTEDLYAVEVPGGTPAPDGGGTADARPPDAAPPPSNRALAVELSPSEGLATVLELRTAAGAVLGSSTGAAGAHHGLPNISVRPGERYLIAVRLDRPRKNAPPVAPGPATYVLAVRETSLGAGDEREPNDTLENATPLGPAHAAPEMAGYFGTGGDRDFYRVPIGEASEATLVSVFLTPPSSITASLAVFDRAGTRLQGVRGHPGERLVLRNLSPAALSPAAPDGAPGFFYVAAQTEAGADLEHRYVLGIRSEPSPETEREPDDQPVRATPINPGISSGHLGPGDVDFFRCEVAAGAEIAAQVSPPKKVDVVIELLLPGAVKPQRADAARRGQSERLTARATAAGPALIRVQGRRPTDYDNDEPYSLTVELRAGAAPGGEGQPPP
jgi:hypothetical protein